MNFISGEGRRPVQIQAFVQTRQRQPVRTCVSLTLADKLCETLPEQGADKYAVPSCEIVHLPILPL
jgi:hypothetical protein